MERDRSRAASQPEHRSLEMAIAIELQKPASQGAQILLMTDPWLSPIAASADVNPAEQVLEPIFDDHSGRKRFTGPIAFAIDGKDETAWGIDAGPGRRNVPRNAVFVLEKPVSFPAGVRVYAYCRTIPNCYGENSSLILGTRGRCDLLKLRIEGETKWEHPGAKSKGNAYDLEHVALFDSIRNSKPINNGDYMVRSTLITLMGQFSCYTGKEVTWDRITSSDFFYPPRPEECRMDKEPPVRPDKDGIYPVFVPGETVLL